MITIRFKDRSVLMSSKYSEIFELAIHSSWCSIRKYESTSGKQTKQNLEIICNGKTFRFTEDKNYITLKISDTYYPIQFNQFIEYILNKTADEIIEDSLKITSKFKNTTKDGNNKNILNLTNEQASLLVNSGKISAMDYVGIIQHNANKIDKPGLNSKLFTVEFDKDWWIPYCGTKDITKLPNGAYLVSGEALYKYITNNKTNMKTKKKTSEEILKEKGYKYSFHTFGKDRKITICIGIYKPFGITQIVNCGYAICRPNDTFNEHVAHLISSGRLAGEAQMIELGVLEHKPSKDTIKGLAKDAYHYILDHKNKFFIEPKTKIKKDEHKQSTGTNKKDRGTK